MDSKTKINGMAILMLGASFLIYLGRDTLARMFGLDEQSYYVFEVQGLALIFMGFSILVFQYLRGAFLVNQIKASSFESKISSSE